MADILIRRCRLRVVRRGGWSWGADQRELVAAALRALQELVCARLAALWQGEAELDIAAPLRIRIPLHVHTLLAIGRGGLPALAPGAPRIELEQAVEHAVRALVGQAVQARAGGVQPVIATALLARAEPHTASPAALPGMRRRAVLAVLLRWHGEGVLAARLMAFAPAALEAWHGHLAAPGAEPSAQARVMDEVTLRALWSQIGALPLPLAPSRRKALIQRLCMAVEAAARFAIAPADPAFCKLLDALAPIAADGAPADAALAHPAPPAASRAPSAAGASPRASPAAVSTRLPAVAVATELDVPCALPFLLLGPLARAGYLEVLAASMEAAGLAHVLPSFATALARKVLPPPGRGWLRRPGAILSAAAFAGAAEPVPDPQLAGFARTAGPHLSPLDAVLGASLMDGHRSGQPVLLQQADLAGHAGFQLVDCEGIFPMVRAERLPQLFAALARLPGSTIVVPQDAAGGEALAQLDKAGFVFVTDAAPMPNESWRRAEVPGQAARWTNGSPGAAPCLAPAAEQLAYARDESAALWSEVALRRRACPVGCDGGVEASLALAAAFALGTIAWLLWREREPVTPLLALQRFGDLDARVRFDADAVTVHLPLGRRYIDLYQHGLLADVRSVPWLAGRILRFAQG